VPFLFVGLDFRKMFGMQVNSSFTLASRDLEENVDHLRADFRILADNRLAINLESLSLRCWSWTSWATASAPLASHRLLAASR
jgi:hypothetical protein